MDLENKDHYQVLGVPRDATKAQIREAYLEIARIYHPDSNFYNDIVESGTNKEEQHIFKIVTAAYSVLNDDRRRAEYTAGLPPDESTAKMTQEQSDQMFAEAKTWHRSRFDEEEGKRSVKYRERKSTVSFQRPRADSMTMSAVGRETMMRQQVAAEAKEKMKQRMALLFIFVVGIVLGTVILVLIR